MGNKFAKDVKIFNKVDDARNQGVIYGTERIGVLVPELLEISHVM
jgi:hypothetical protein